METELGSMLVRLTGDGSEYQRMLSGAQAQTQSSVTQIEQASRRIDGIANSMKGFAGTALNLLSSFGLTTTLKSAFDSYSKMEVGVLRLSSAIEFNGQNVEATQARYMRFAKSLESTTMLTKGQIFGMLTQAETMGFSGDVAERVTQQAVALGAATGQSAESMIAVTAALERGNTQMLRRIRQLRGYRTESELVSAAERLMASGMRQAQAEANTTSGQIFRLGRSLKSVGREIGSVVAQAITPFIEGLRGLFDWFKSLSPQIKSTVAALIGGLMAFKAFGPAVGIIGSTVGSLLAPLGAIGGLLLTTLNPINLVRLAFVALRTTVLLTALSFARVGIFALGLLNPMNLVRYGIQGIVISLRILRSAFMLTFGPVGLAIAGVLALIGMFASEGDSLASLWDNVKSFAVNAWNNIKAAIQRFAVWAFPIWQAILSLSITIWEGVKSAAETAWTFIRGIAEGVWRFISGIFGNISDDAGITWDSIRDTIQTAILAVEFGLRNFGQVAQFVWTWAQLKAVEFAGVVSHFFTTVIPTVVQWFANNWRDIFTTLYNYTTTVIVNLANNIVRVIVNIPNLIQGTVNFADLWTPLTQGFVNTIRQLPEIPAREMGALEQAIRAEFNSQQSALTQDFNAFREQRLAEFARQSAAARRPAEEAGRQIGMGLNKGMQKEAEKFDAVLSNSAEAVTRVQNYMDRIRFGSSEQRPRDPASAIMAASTAATNAIRNQAAAINTATANTGANAAAMWQNVGAVGANAFGNIQGIGSNIFSGIGTLWNNALQGWSALGQTVWTGIQNAATGFWNMMGLDGNALWQAMTNAGSIMWQGITALGGNAWNTISAVAVALWNGDIAAAASAMWSGALTAAQTLWTMVSGLATNTWNVIQSVATSTWNNITTLATQFWNNLPNIASNAWSAITSTASSAWSGVTSGIGSAWSGMTTMVGNAWTGMSRGVFSLFRGTSQLLSRGQAAMLRRMGIQVSDADVEGEAVSLGNAIAGAQQLLQTEQGQQFMQSGLGQGIQNQIQALQQMSGIGQGPPIDQPPPDVNVQVQVPPQQNPWASLPGVQAAMQVLQQGAQPGSIYVHDVHTEALLGQLKQMMTSPIMQQAPAFAQQSISNLLNTQSPIVQSLQYAVGTADSKAIQSTSMTAQQSQPDLQVAQQQVSVTQEGMQETNGFLQQIAAGIQALVRKPGSNISVASID